ncbi:hypothetical protein EIP91_010770 [Steccherinum ochraceum]|uniref:Ubiquinol-cytochrome C reductase hinge domain-containing protein n=1 Tax=Steccherinum ochraceum TaxID=92696 RepID=A0A4R0R5I1_9APHY|nr:hypothetical protein EIP91_010770 [Steccherinum ochraceum]
MSLAAFFSSFVSTVYNDAPADEHKEADKAEEPEQPEAEEPAAAEEEEEVEPEDIMPEIVEECKQSKACATATKHFVHCEEKVNAGKGYEHEDCVEEFCASFPAACLLTTDRTIRGCIYAFRPHDALRQRLCRTKTVLQAQIDVAVRPSNPAFIERICYRHTLQLHFSATQSATLCKIGSEFTSDGASRGMGFCRGSNAEMQLRPGPMR